MSRIRPWTLILFLFFLNPSFGIAQEACSEIVFKHLELTKNKARCYTINITLRNSGNAPVSFKGQTMGSADNPAIQYFYSGDNKYNKGDILAGGFFISKKGIHTLKPEESFSFQVKISKKKKSNYSGFLIFRFDPANALRECAEDNNEAALSLPY